MPQPKIICKHCGGFITIGGFDFPDRESLEDSDLLDVRIFCPWCEGENVWNKDEVINTLEFPHRASGSSVENRNHLLKSSL